MNKMTKHQKVQVIDDLFSHIGKKPEALNTDEMIYVLESVIPVHVDLVITNHDEVDELLAIYPYIYQKLIKIYAYFIHKVREGKQKKLGVIHVNTMMGYRDCLEQIIKAVKLQYDSLSRRITNDLERRT